MTLPSQWSEFIGLSSAARVRFLIVGAHALAVHGRPRATGDLDILEPTAANAIRLAEALERLGFAKLARQTTELATPNRMVTLGRPPLRIAVMTSISGVSFAQAWRGRRTVRFGDHRVGVLGRNELARNERAAGRPQDLLDLELLAATRPERRGKARPAQKRR